MHHSIPGAAAAGAMLALTSAVAAQDITVLVTEGVAAPGAPGYVITNLNAPFTNGLGEVGFTGSLEDDIGATSHFVWCNGQVIWHNALTEGVALSGAEATMGISDDCAFIYSPSADGDDAVWTDAGLLLKETDPAPGFPGQFITFASRPRMLPDGTAYWISGLSPVQGGSTQARGLYTATPEGDIAPVVASGDRVGGFTVDFPGGVDFDYDVSDNNEHFINVIGTAEGPDIVAVDLIPVAVQDQPTGQGDNWDSFDIVSINNAGNYIFTGDTDGPTAADEFIAYNGEIAIRQGDTIDGITLDGGSFRAASINNPGLVAHLWGISGGEEVLFIGQADDLANTSIALLQTGDEIDTDGDRSPDAIVDDFNASTVIGPGLSLADDGFVHVEVDLVPVVGGDDFEAILSIAIPGGLAPCPGDLDDSGDVGVADLLELLAAWGFCPPDSDCPADLTGDASVGVADLLELLAAWGPCS